MVITTQTYQWRCRECRESGRVEDVACLVHKCGVDAVDLWPLVSRSNDTMGTSTARCPLCDTAFPDPDWSGPGEACPGCGVVWQHELRPTAESLRFALDRAARQGRAGGAEP